MKREGRLIVVSGFSGAGKGTLMKRLVEEYDQYALSVSMTTRKPRVGEENGREYFFADKEDFEEKIRQDGLIEYACYCGNYYGTPRDYVEQKMAQGKDVILEIEIQGAMKIKDKFPQAILLFVTPPSAEVLLARLRGRGTETEEVIRTRMQRAAQESEGMDQYDYLVINDDLEECVRGLHNLLNRDDEAISEGYRPENNRIFIEQIRTELNSLVKGEK
jgi:guanylate kinase